MKNIVFVAQSLDGYIATKDGSTNWLNIPNPTKTDYGYNNFIKQVDAIIMGRHTFEKALTYKPYPYTIPVFVISNSLKNIPINLQDNVKIVRGALKEILENLGNLGYQTIYIDGGSTIQSFLKEDLIDEMTISTIPIILGDGISLFGTMDKTIYFKHYKTIAHENGIVTTFYSK